MNNLEKKFSNVELDDFRQSNQSYECQLQDTIKPLQNILDDEMIESIKQIFYQVFTETKRFEDFENSVRCYCNLINYVDGLIAGGPPGIEEKLIHLYNLKRLVNQVSYSKRIDFMKSILKQKNSKDILFSSSFTAEGINKRFRKIASYFHPDKNIKVLIPEDLQEEYKNLCNELFKCTSALRESLLLNLDASYKMSPIVFHQEKGNEFWIIAIDYRNAHKEQWTKLKHLKKDDLIGPPEIFRIESISYAKLAYQEYRQACKLADQEKLLKSQIELRGYMALCLYISDQFMEAQLYALSTIRLIYRYSNQVTIQELNHAKSILNKVKGYDSGEKSEQLKTEIKLKTSSVNQHALVMKESGILSKVFSYIEIKTSRQDINDDLDKISNEFALSVNRSLVCWQANREEILLVEKYAKSHLVGGTLVCSSALTALYTGAIFALEGYVAATAASVFLGGPLIGVIGLGLYCGIGLFKKGTQLFKEPKIREALNEIMKNALHAYDKGDYQLFFNELSKNYNSKTRLLKFECRKDLIKTEDIVNELLLHGFRPDGIAYLLNLIGEVLNSGKIKVEGMLPEDFKPLGAAIWSEIVENKKLIDEANKLDDRIKVSRNKTYIAHWNKLSDFIHISGRSRLAKIYKDDEQEKPFVSRLEENRQTARINLAIRDILNGNSEHIERAKKTIKEVQQSINSNHQYFGNAETRLEMLEDFLWVLSGEESTQSQFDSRLRLTNI